MYSTATAQPKFKLRAWPISCSGSLTLSQGTTVRSFFYPKIMPGRRGARSHNKRSGSRGATYATKRGAKSGQHVLSMDRNLFMQSNRSMFFDRPVLHGRPETTKHLWHGSCYFHDGFMSYDHCPAGIAMILFGLVVIQPESC